MLKGKPFSLKQTSSESGQTWAGHGPSSIKGEGYLEATIAGRMESISSRNDPLDIAVNSWASYTLLPVLWSFRLTKEQ
jgi:hypothetical protein